MGLPRSGIEPVFPGLAGGFFTTEPPGKSPWESFNREVTENHLGGDSLSLGKDLPWRSSG